MDWMLMPYRRYFDFSGRSRRKEYWMFALLIFLIYIVMAFLSVMSGGSAEMGEAPTGGAASMVIGLVFLVWAVGTLIPSLAVAVRRLHDTDRSGWWLLIGLVPLVGGLVLLYFYLIEGTHGPNRFGPDPKEGEARGV